MTVLRDPRAVAGVVSDHLVQAAVGDPDVAVGTERDGVRHVVLVRAERFDDLSRRKLDSRDRVLGDGGLHVFHDVRRRVKAIAVPEATPAVKRPRVPPVGLRDDPGHLPQGLGPPLIRARRVHEVRGQRLRFIRSLRGCRLGIGRVLNRHAGVPVRLRARARQVRGLLRVYHQVEVAHLVAVSPPRARHLGPVPGVIHARHANLIPGANRQPSVVDPLKQLRQLRVAAHKTHRGKRLAAIAAARRPSLPRLGLVRGPSTAREAFRVHLDPQRVRVHSKRKRSQRPSHRVDARVPHADAGLTGREREPLREGHDGHRAVRTAAAEVHGEPRGLVGVRTLRVEVVDLEHEMLEAAVAANLETDAVG